VFLEAKDRHLIEQIAPYVDALVAAGMWISDDLRRRVLHLAGEASSR
jgi:predicted nucleic acid-binding protein